MMKMPKRIVGCLLLSLSICIGLFLILKFGFLAAHKRPNIILVTANSLRPEHLSCYGYEHINTGAIDKLAKGAALFKDAYCQIPVTGFSYASLLTGKIGSAIISQNGERVSFNLSHKLLSEYLKELGYSTAAVVSDPFLASSKIFFNRGFDTFENVPPEGITEKALKILAESRKKPVFAWISYSIPSFPYMVPESFQKAKDDFIYDRQVLLLDEEIAKLMEGLKRLGLKKNTLIIFTATTGEGLDEHKEPAHGVFLYNSTVKIPLIIKLPGERSGKIIKDPACLADLAPTILGALKINLSEDAFDGKNLFLREKKKEPRLIYLESLTGYENFGWSPLAGIVLAGYKYIEAPKPELYDLTQDPYELKNIASPDDKKTREMRGELYKFLEKRRPPLLAIINKGPDPKDRVEVLKPYFLVLMQSRGAESSVLIDAYKALLAKDPENKAFILALAKLYFQTDKPNMTEDYLKKLTAKYPDSVEALELLAIALEKQNNLDEAIKCLEKAISIFPDTPGALNNLAWFYLQKGIKLDEALKYSQRANELVPDFAHFMDTLAQAYFKKGEKQKALELQKKAIFLDPKLEILQTHLKEMESAP